MRMYDMQTIAVIYVRSEAAAKRVSESMIQYIEGKLLLKVNREKTKVSRPNESTLLGFTFVKPNQDGKSG